MYNEMRLATETQGEVENILADAVVEDMLLGATGETEEAEESETEMASNSAIIGIPGIPCYLTRSQSQLTGNARTNSSVKQCRQPRIFVLVSFSEVNEDLVSEILCPYHCWNLKTRQPV